VIVATRDQQQRRPVGVLEVDLIGAVRVEVGEGALPEDPPGARDRVAVVDRPRFLLAHRVGERVVELLGGDRHGAVTVGRALEDREGRAQGRDRQLGHAADRRRVDPDAGVAVAVAEQDLGDRAAEGVAHDDRLALDRAEELLHVVEDFLEAEIFDLAGVGADLVDRAVEARPGRRLDL
jgi:hypothetical protein